MPDGDEKEVKKIFWEFILLGKGRKRIGRKWCEKAQWYHLQCFKHTWPHAPWFCIPMTQG